MPSFFHTIIIHVSEDENVELSPLKEIDTRHSLSLVCWIFQIVILLDYSTSQIKQPVL